MESKWFRFKLYSYAYVNNNLLCYRNRCQWLFQYIQRNGYCKCLASNYCFSIPNFCLSGWQYYYFSRWRKFIYMEPKWLWFKLYGYSYF